MDINVNEMAMQGLEQSLDSAPSQQQVDLFREMLDRQALSSEAPMDTRSDYLAGLGEQVSGHLASMQEHHHETNAILENLAGLDNSANPERHANLDERAADIGPFDDPQQGNTHSVSIQQLLDKEAPDIRNVMANAELHTSGNTGGMRAINFDSSDSSNKSIGQIVADAGKLSVIDQRQEQALNGKLPISNELYAATEMSKQMSQHAMQKSIVAMTATTEAHLMVTATANASSAITSNVKTLMRGS